MFSFYKWVAVVKIIFSKRFFVICWGLFLAACVFDTASVETLVTENPTKSLRYIVKLTQTPEAKCDIEMDIEKWPQAEPLLFQAPTFYPDNPLLPLPSLQASQIKGVNAWGEIVMGRDTSVWSDTLSNHFIVFPAGLTKLLYSIDYAPNNSQQFGLPIPGIGDNVQLIDGAYFFLLPFQGNDYARHWRYALNANVEFKLPKEMTLVGQPLNSHFVNNYALMFLRAVINPVEVSHFMHRGKTITTYRTAEDSASLSSLNLLLAKCLNWVEDSLGSLSGDNYSVGITPLFDGIEGDQGYWIKAEHVHNAAVHLHELTHNFVGVHQGELNDPWWKEGLANYVGLLLAYQAGFISDTLFKNNLVLDLDSFPAVHNLSLRDPIIRNHLFSTLDSDYKFLPDANGFIYLVYTKGAQASMIIDRYIYEQSQGKYSIYSLIRDLYHNKKPYFTSDDFQSLINKYSGTSSDKFIKDLLESSGVFSLDSLNSCFNALLQQPRFSEKIKTKN